MKQIVMIWLNFCLLNNGGLRFSYTMVILQEEIYINSCPLIIRLLYKIFKEDILKIFKYFEKKGGEPISKLRVE